MSNNLPIYPDVLPLPLLKSHSVKRKENLLVSKMESGYKRTRRRFKSVPASQTARWLIRDGEAALLEAFLQNNDGWFVMPVKLPAGVIPCEVKAIESPTMKAITNSKWEFSVKMIIKDPAIISAEIIDILSIYSLFDLETAARRSIGMTL